MIRQKFQFLIQIIQKWIKSSEEKIVKIQPTSNQFSKKIMTQVYILSQCEFSFVFRLLMRKARTTTMAKRSESCPATSLLIKYFIKATLIKLRYRCLFISVASNLAGQDKGDQRQEDNSGMYGSPA